jgi:hypothetical protein
VKGLSKQGREGVFLWRERDMKRPKADMMKAGLLENLMKTGPE